GCTSRRPALANPCRGHVGVGPAVLGALPAELPGTVDAVDGGTPGLETVLMLQGYDLVVVVDAAEMGLAPGSWRQFERDAIRMQTRDMALRGTLHYAGLAEALALAEALDMLPPRITVFGVQPEDTGWAPGLSEPVRAAVEPVATAITAYLTREVTTKCDT
ncbi:MAG: hydrogenase maturation protease, partial [Chloroflexi bacterium]|nr:hydrogenase maturation protease [Chloroflexota bacterium]